MLTEQSTEIHPTAVVEDGAVIGRGVRIGPYCVIGPRVVIGDGCRLQNHVTVVGQTVLGENCEVFQQAVLGAIPQDLKYRGTATRLEIGDRNVFREQCTVHPGTEHGGGVTRIGNDNLFLVGVHIAHDCAIGHGCILANYVQLGGHVILEDCVNFGGHCGVHHFVTAGKYSMVGGLSPITQDVPPFMIVVGARGSSPRVRYINRVGMKRNGFTEEQMQAVKVAQMKLFSLAARRSGRPMLQAVADMRESGPLDPNVEYLLDFLVRSFEHGRNGRYLESLRQA
ncbi:MAG: acyl-ACP--UDP-N-acetylglucosamine O-acyltransferase [Phycisphaerales bacterium]|nr:MAG: acyl-ACP--UDP-N-acetylglucosamine O-acyltransferase [Phycisphaerales bacterium]